MYEYYYVGDNACFCIRQAASGGWLIDVTDFDGERTYGGYDSLEHAFRCVLDMDDNVLFDRSLQGGVSSSSFFTNRGTKS